MAQIQSRVFDLGQLMALDNVFFQQQYEKQKQALEMLVAMGSLEDVINSAPQDSLTYRDYYQYMSDLNKYSEDLLKGSKPAGIMADRAVDIFRNYGKIKGRADRVLEQLKTSQTNRFNAVNQHPGGVIWQSNNVTDNIDALANGKTVNDKFIDRKGALDIVLTLFANIGAALARDNRYLSIKETEGYSVEMLLYGGLDALVIDDIWQTGTSNKVSKETVDVIRHYIELTKQSLGYDLFDEIGLNQLYSLIKTGAVGAMSNPKYNVIDSGALARAQLGYNYAVLGDRASARASKANGKSKPNNTQTNNNTQNNNLNLLSNSQTSLSTSTPPTRNKGVVNSKNGETKNSNKLT